MKQLISPPQLSTTDAAIFANLQILSERLAAAAHTAAEAAASMTAGERNLAIGTVLVLEKLLPEFDALYRTTVLLHQSPQMPVAA